MPLPAAIPASPPDIAAILTSLGIFSLAIAAVVGGIYKGVKEVKKGGEDTDKSLAGAILMDHMSVRLLVDSNLRLAESNREIVDMLRDVDRTGGRVVEALQDHREMTRSQIEEQHRLRAATVDLVDQMRRNVR